MTEYEGFFPKSFWGEVRKNMENGQRKGQAVYNAAAEFYPEGASKLNWSVWDPFNRDEKVKGFLEKLLDLLTSANQ